jgi:hypothetical protein
MKLHGLVVSEGGLGSLYIEDPSAKPTLTPKFLLKPDGLLEMGWAFGSAHFMTQFFFFFFINWIGLRLK